MTTKKLTPLEEFVKNELSILRADIHFYKIGLKHVAHVHNEYLLYARGRLTACHDLGIKLDLWTDEIDTEYKSMLNTLNDLKLWTKSRNKI